MPATEDIPTVEDLLGAFHGAVAARRQDADVHDGSMYEHPAGIGALLFRRVATRDRDQFHDLYFASARGTALDAIVAARYADLDPRAQLTRGAGIATLTRPDASAGAGTLRAGTRIGVALPGAARLTFYRITSDLAVGATDVDAMPAIEAETPGTGSAITVAQSDSPRVLRFEDPLWDTTWKVDSLACNDGTDYERDEDLKARIKQQRYDSRVGYERRLVDVCTDAGAKIVAPFPSDWLGSASDHGLNRLYVGDAGYSTPDAMLLACRLAMYANAVCGASVQVLPVTRSDLSLAITIRTWDAPESRNKAADMLAAASAVVNYFKRRESVFTWRESGIRTAVQRAVRGTQSVDITPSASEPTLATLFNTSPLPAWFIRSEAITVSMLGPA